MSTETTHIVLTDVHGCYHTMVRLLNRCPHGAQLFLNGDLIDRGPHSRKVVEFAMQNEVPTVCGNHEDLALAFYENEGFSSHCGSYYERGIWLHNGGDKAAANWPTIDKRSTYWRRDQNAGGRVPDEVLRWMEALPAYITPDNAPLDENGRRLLVSHSGYGLAADKGTNDAWMTALWARHGFDCHAFATDPLTGEERDDGWFRVFGHTPAKQPVITDTFAMIDTGAAYSARGYGNMTAFLWPTKQVITQPFDETAPATLTWEGAKGAPATA